MRPTRADQEETSHKRHRVGRSGWPVSLCIAQGRIVYRKSTTSSPTFPDCHTHSFMGLFQVCWDLVDRKIRFTCHTTERADPPAEISFFFFFHPSSSSTTLIHHSSDSILSRGNIFLCVEIPKDVPCCSTCWGPWRCRKKKGHSRPCPPGWRFRLEDTFLQRGWILGVVFGSMGLSLFA